MASGQRIALEFGRRWVRAVVGRPVRVAGSSLPHIKVTRVFVEAIPDGMAPFASGPRSAALGDINQLGEWLADRLAASHVTRAPVIVALARELVVVKRLTLPTVDPVELPGMARLAMQRELPFDSDTAVIDFTTVETQTDRTSVIAVAVPGAIIDDVRACMAAAGLKIDAISLRTFGAAAIVRAASESAGAFIETHASDGARLSTDADPSVLLCLDVTGDAVELCVVGPEGIRFSRSAEAGVSDEALAAAEGVITEARRTWMSYRAIDDAVELGAVVILGESRIGDLAAGAIGEMVKAPVTVLESCSAVEGNAEDLERVWALAGLLLEAARAPRSRINFSSPRRPPDIGARRRIRTLAAAGLVLVAGFLAWTMASNKLRALQERAEALESRQAELVEPFLRHHRERYRLEHLKRWESGRVDWLAHADFVNSIFPGTSHVVLDSWQGTLDFGGVRFDKKTKKWSAPREITIVLDGEARDRATADAFRESLVGSKEYITSSTGADAKGGKRLPYGFTYRLRTSEISPQAPPDAAEASDPAPADTQAAVTDASASASTVTTTGDSPAQGM